MFYFLCDELSSRILVKLDDEKLEIFAATSERNHRLVKKIDANGLEMAVRALAIEGYTLDPDVIRATKFIGISFLRFQGRIEFFSCDVCSCQ